MSKDTNKITSGTKEWSDYSHNFARGCEHDCSYCYAKRIAIRFNRCVPDSFFDNMEKWLGNRDDPFVKSYIDLMQDWFNKWSRMTLIGSSVRRVTKRAGRGMCPTSHDLVPRFVDQSVKVISDHLAKGNKLLVTTKPHLDVVKALDAACKPYNKQGTNTMQYRFTITTDNDEKLADWERGAPKFKERFDSLVQAHADGFETSISMEPCLDADPRELIDKLRPHVTGSIWLGVLNYSGNWPWNSESTVIKWWSWFKDDPKIKFKDSVMNVVNKTIFRYVEQPIKKENAKNGKKQATLF